MDTILAIKEIKEILENLYRNLLIKEEKKQFEPKEILTFSKFIAASKLENNMIKFELHKWAMCRRATIETLHEVYKDMYRHYLDKMAWSK